MWCLSWSFCIAFCQELVLVLRGSEDSLRPSPDRGVGEATINCQLHCAASAGKVYNILCFLNIPHMYSVSGNTCAVTALGRKVAVGLPGPPS